MTRVSQLDYHRGNSMKNPTKVYRLVVCVVDHENMGIDDIVGEIENVKYSAPFVHETQEVTVDWDDDHPLNKTDTSDATFKSLFKDVPSVNLYE